MDKKYETYEVKCPRGGCEPYVPLPGDDFFFESYTDNFFDPLLLATYADFICDWCLREWAGYPLVMSFWAKQRAAAGVPDRDDPAFDRMTRAEILADLSRMVGL